MFTLVLLLVTLGCAQLINEALHLFENSVLMMTVILDASELRVITMTRPGFRITGDTIISCSAKILLCKYELSIKYKTLWWGGGGLEKWIPQDNFGAETLKTSSCWMRVR
jgi:hypothetical protein